MGHGGRIVATPKAGGTLTNAHVDDLGGLLEVQEEGQATLLLLVVRARKPASGAAGIRRTQWHLQRRKRSNG